MTDTVHTMMSPETLEALKGSIAKWEGIVAGTVVNLHADNCPLCQLFNPYTSNTATFAAPCKGCPVMARTGVTFCGGTPYDEYAELEERVDEGEGDEGGLKPLAVQELDFLKSLLPTDARSDDPRSPE